MSAIRLSHIFVNFQQSIAVAKDVAAVDDVMRCVWQSNGVGRLSDDEAQTLSDLAQARRGIRVTPPTSAVARMLSRFKPRRRQCPPDRHAARERRRDLGGAGNMPGTIRRAFTEGQRAVLTIIAGEVKHHGRCDLPIDKIAALAGCGRTTVQNAVHEARRLGLINVAERPQRGQKSLTNIVTIISAEWRAWLKRGPAAHRPIGSKVSSRTSKMMNPTKIKEARKDLFGAALSCSDAPSRPVAGLREERIAAVAQRGASWR